MVWHYQPYCAYIHEKKMNVEKEPKVVWDFSKRKHNCNRFYFLLISRVFNERLHILVFFSSFFYGLFVNATLKPLYFSTKKMGPNIFIVQRYPWTHDFLCVRVCEQCYGLVKVFIEYCHELTLSTGNKLFLKNTSSVFFFNIICVSSVYVSVCVCVVGVVYKATSKLWWVLKCDWNRKWQGLVSDLSQAQVLRRSLSVSVWVLQIQCHCISVVNITWTFDETKEVVYIDK